MYSSVCGTRAASVAAAPYMPTVKSEQAARNQSMLLRLVSNAMPRAQATRSSTAIWSARR